jgi:hypothetical protein
MDFDVNIGDTISSLMSSQGIAGPGYYRATVLDKDSTQLTDGSYNTFLYLSTDSITTADGFQGNGSEVVWQEKGLCYANNWPSYYSFAGGLIYNLGPYTQPDLSIYLNPTSCSSDTIIPYNFYNYGHTCDMCNPIANGILENQIKLFNVYPNPANEMLFIDSDFDVKGIRIYDLSGKLIESEENIAANKIRVNYLNNGLYLLNVTFQNGNSQTQQLIISR